MQKKVIVVQKPNALACFCGKKENSEGLKDSCTRLFVFYLRICISIFL